MKITKKCRSAVAATGVGYWQFREHWFTVVKDILRVWDVGICFEPRFPETDDGDILIDLYSGSQYLEVSLYVQWHKMEISGRWEITCYLT